MCISLNIIKNPVNVAELLRKTKMNYHIQSLNKHNTHISKNESSYGIMSFYKDNYIVCLRKLGHGSVTLHLLDKDGRSCIFKDNDFIDSNLHFAFVLIGF